MKTKTTSKNMKHAILFGCLMVGLSLTAAAQVKVGDNPNQIVSGARLQVDGNNTTTTASKLIVTGTGNVGLGTAAPATSLHIVNTGTGGTGVFTTNTANMALRLENTGNGQSVIQHLFTKDASGVAKQMIMGVNPTFLSGNGAFLITRDGGNDFTLNLLNGNFGIGIQPTTTEKMSIGATADPLRLSGLQNSATIAGTTSRTIVTDANGVLKTKNKDNVSAVRVTGSVTLAANNTFYFTDATATPVEAFDNLNEFSGHTFTAAQDGLYQVHYTVRYKQVTGTSYLGYASLQVGDAASPADYGDLDVIQVPNPLTGVTSLTLVKSDLVKLTAGQVILFRVLDFNAAANYTATYTINVNRID